MNKRRRVVLALGAGAFAPLASFAQQPSKIPRIGYLGLTTAAGAASRLVAFRAGLREFGYVEGKTILVDYRWAEGNYGRLPELAEELVQIKVDMIVTAGTQGSLAAKQATTTIPIVIAAVGDAVGAGIVTNLARPGGNITGSSYFLTELLAKRVELIKEAVPRIAKVAFLRNVRNPEGSALPAMQIAAKALKIDVQMFLVRGPEEFRDAFATMAKKRFDALVIPEDAVLLAHLKTLADLAMKQLSPAAGSSEFAEAGALFGYGANVSVLYHRAAYFVNKILEGVKPSEIRVEQPTTFEFTVNMKTAKALGVKIPNSVLVRATKLIE